MKKKYWILIVILILFLFPELDTYQKGWDSVTQWQLGDFRYMVENDCRNCGGIPTPKNIAMLDTFFVHVSYEWGDCEGDKFHEWLWNSGFRFYVKDKFNVGYALFGIDVTQNYGSIYFLDRWLCHLSLYDTKPPADE